MTTAYQGEPSDGTMGLSELSYIPYTHILKNGRRVQVGPFLSTEWPAGMELMNFIIREGNTWPFDKEFETIDSYRGYFLSHAAFAVRALDDGVDSHGRISPAGDLLGCFYIKPNYPGRCSHICNGGFITAPHARRLGVANLMGRLFLRIANDLGYKSAYFNLVFRSNHASVALWESLGFQRVAVLEQAAKLKGMEGLDTAYGYRYDFSTFNEKMVFPKDNMVK
jgi:RimJ/RimL family protein N-acetyltransferase